MELGEKMVAETQNKYYDYYLLLNHWLEAKHFGHNAAEYFVEEGYKNIAIYGMGDLANRLCEDLANSKICVSYGIDRDVAVSISRLSEVYAPEDELKAVDVVVVTPFHAYESINIQLREKLSCPIISLEEVIWSI